MKYLQFTLKPTSILRVSITYTPKLYYVALLLMLPIVSIAQLNIRFPVPRAVIQRDVSNKADLYITGHVDKPCDKIEAQLIPRTEQSRLDTIVASTWQTVSQGNILNAFVGKINAKGGWYNLKIRTLVNNTIQDSITIERIGVGEVLISVGHSNAQGGSYGVTGPDATDDRVNCIEMGKVPSCEGRYPRYQPASNTDSTWCNYLATGDANVLPILRFKQITNNSGMSPFSDIPWFWSILGDSLSRQLNVPILIYNAAFGGTTSEYWYKAAYNIYFYHSFVNANIGMPYINLKNILQLYVPLTGVRTVLTLHGVNEREAPADDIKRWMNGYIVKSREDSKIPNLSWVIALDSYLGWVYPNPLEAQLHTIAHTPYAYRGPDLNSIIDNHEGMDGSDRPDGLHFSARGIIAAANMWTNNLMENQLLVKIAPTGPQPLWINSLQSGYWNTPQNWSCNCFPQNYHSMRVTNSHIINIDNKVLRPVQIKIDGGLYIAKDAIISF